MTATNNDLSQHPGVETGAAKKELEADQSWQIEESPPELIESPIDFLFAEHHRQRQAANILHLIADGEFNEAGVTKLLKFLKTDFAIHVADEELSFFPLLREHCLPEDEIDKLIERLAEEHKKDEATVENMIVVLEGLLAGEKLTHKLRRSTRSFAEHILQHLALENAILLPIARGRLDAEALAALSDMFKQRRA